MNRSTRLFLSAALALPFSADASAQICHAENDTPNFSDNTSTGGPNLLIAIKFTAPTNIACTRLEVFTGEKSGTNTLGLWSHDGGGNKPTQSLGTTSWSMATANGWQGANLATPISLNAGATYWLVWGTVNGSQSSIEAGSSPGQQYRPSFDGGQTWSGPYSSSQVQWKFRLYCNACPGGFQTYGAGCAGTNGVTPTLAGSGCPAPLSAVTIDMDQMLPGTAALFLLASSNQGAPLTPSCTLQASPLLPPFLAFTVPGSGSLSLSATLPSDTPIPFDLYMQTLIADPGAVDGIASTNPIRMAVQ